MSDIISSLPVNEYHIPTENEIYIMDTLFAIPELPIKKFIYNSLYASICVSFINLFYFKYFNHQIPSHIYVLLSYRLQSNIDNNQPTKTIIDSKQNTRKLQLNSRR